MLEFKIIQELKSNTEILEIIKSFTYKTKNGKVKHLVNTNLQFVEPTEYLIAYPKTITILEYKVNEISNKPFYVKEHNKKYNLKEINQIEWVKLMNNYKNTAEEIVLKEYVFN